MFSNIKEEKLIGSMMDFDRSHPEEIYIMEYEDGTKIKAVYDTDFDTDNGLDLDEDGYEEYWACAFALKEILKNGNSVPCKDGIGYI